MAIDDTSNYGRKRIIIDQKKKMKYQIQFCKIIFERGFPSFIVWLIPRLLMLLFLLLVVTCLGLT